MIVLRIVGILLLAVLVLGIALTVVLLNLSMRIEVKRKLPDGPLRMRIGFGPVKRVWTLGQPRKKKPEQKKQPEKPEKQKKERAPSVPMIDLKRLDYEQAFSLALNLIDDMGGMMTWERLHVTVILHTSDAARTGNLLGMLSAAIGNLYPYLERAFVLKDTKIVIDADFDADRTVWGVDVSIMTRLGRFPRIAWRRRKALWNLWKSIRMTKQQRAQWQKEHTATQMKDMKSI